LRLLLTVSSSASRDEIVGRHGARWKVRVRAAPERGKANAAVVALVARTVEVQASAISLVSGHRSREKVVEIDGLDEEEAGRRLEAAARTSSR
jgi:uncharacterized protein (TIGR00251 family)